MIDDEQFSPTSTSNEIKPAEQDVLSSFFNAGGYVLDFSTEKFNLFAEQSIGIKLCAHYHLSKGKSLAEFVKYGSIEKVVKLFDDLIQYYEYHYV